MADVKSMLELIRLTTAFFEKKGVDPPRLEAEVLLAHVMGVERIQLYAGFDVTPSPEQVDRFRELVRERGKRCPTQYLLGETEFYSRNFKVSRDVLIPRPETEHLVEKAIELCRETPDAVFVDIATGSGCVAVCVAAECPEARVIATDISPEALAIAAQNAEINGVTQRIEFRPGDLFDALEGTGLEGRVNVLASNPPYISRADLADVMPEVRDWEPRIALDGGPDGLDIVRRIADGAAKWLAPGARLLIEIGAGQADDARKIAGDALVGSEIEFVHDLQRIPRVLVAQTK